MPPLIEEWIKKMCYIPYTQWNITQPLKRNEIIPFAATRMDPGNVIMSEVSQTENEKYCMTSLICGI